MKRGFILILLLSVGVLPRAAAQDVAVKTNALYWATTTPNAGVEIGLGKQTTLDITGGYNPWTLNKDQNKKMKHWLVMPEIRYWLCERFNGHFFGLHSGYAFYNISGIRLPLQKQTMKDHRYQGWCTGAGISYGYSWLLGRRWNIEATIGAGYVYASYDKYACAKCGEFKEKGTKHYFGPTKAGITFIYIIK